MIKHEWINTGLILLVAVISLVGIGANNQSQDASYGSVANTYFRMPNSNAQFKTVTSAGDITISDATSCINFYATSTATISHTVASSTATVEGSDGIMLFAYGACP